MPNAAGPDLAVNGSVALGRSLHGAGLIDRCTLLIHPLTLGAGAKMFGAPGPLTEVELISSGATTKGVLIARRQRAES